MKNYFDGWLYESDGAGDFQKKTWASSAISFTLNLFAFTTYPPHLWEALEAYGPLDDPFTNAVGWPILNANGVYLRYDLGGAGIIVPDAIPALPNHCAGPTVTNAVDVTGYHGRLTLPGRAIELAAAGVDYSIRTWGICPGATLQNPNMVTGRDAAGIYTPIFLEETEYTAAMQAAGNLVVGAAATYYILGLWA